jgi:hypothetical protein
MPISYERRAKLRRSRRQVLLDLIRAQQAPIQEPLALYAAVLAEVGKLGLPESDAIWFYQKMQRDGWRISGIPILDWKQTIQSFHQHQHFLSQRM